MPVGYFVWKYVREMRYILCGYSDSNAKFDIRYKNPSNFWFGDLSDSSIKNDIISKHSLLDDFETIRIYANGHMSDGGLPHKDHEEGGFYTFLYYPHLEWEYYWGGETLFFDDYSNLIKCVIPKANSGVLFDSRITHFARTASLYANIDSGFRITIAVKLKKRN